MIIRPRKNSKGKVTSWQLDCGMLHGKRVQLSFKTQQRAQAEMAARKGHLKKHGESGFALTESERAAFAEARDRLSSAGASIDAAVDFFLQHAKPRREPVGFSELVRRCIDAKEMRGLRPKSLRNLRYVGEAFGLAGHELQPAHEINHGEVVAWLNANEWAPATWNNHLTDLQTIFAWAKDEGYVSLNPCREIKRREDTAREHDVEFLHVSEVERILHRASRRGKTPSGQRRDQFGHYDAVPAAEEDFRDFVPFLTLGFFCGLRPERELGEMDDMSDVHVAEGIVIVKGTRAKTRSRRVVTLPVNAKSWLRAFPKSGKVLPRNFKRRWQRLREQCGFTFNPSTWPHDGMRHTFATYHYAMHQDERKLQAEMGHESGQMLHQQYRGLGRPKDAKRFWALRP